MRNATSDRGALERTVSDGTGEYLSDRDGAIDRLRYAQKVLTDTDFIDADIANLEEELSAVAAMLRVCIEQNAANTVTEESYRAAHDDLCSRYKEIQTKLATLQKQRDKMKADAITIGGMMFELGELDDLPLTFDEKLWQGTVDHVTIYADERGGIPVQGWKGSQKRDYETKQKQTQVAGMILSTWVCFSVCPC